MAHKVKNHWRRSSPIFFSHVREGFMLVLFGIGMVFFPLVGACCHLSQRLRPSRSTRRAWALQGRLFMDHQVEGTRLFNYRVSGFRTLHLGTNFCRVRLQLRGFRRDWSAKGSDQYARVKTTHTLLTALANSYQSDFRSCCRGRYRNSIIF